MVRYCRARKASAPTRIASAISPISGLPDSALRTCRASQAATARESKLMIKTIGKTNSVT